jgi:hypothetical protein
MLLQYFERLLDNRDRGGVSVSCGSLDEPVQVAREARQSYAGITGEERNGFAPSVEARDLDEGSAESEQARRCRNGASRRSGPTRFC